MRSHAASLHLVPPPAPDAVSVRPVTLDDLERIDELRAGVSEAGHPLRFFSDARVAHADAYRRSPDSGIDHYGLLAQAPDGTVLAHAAYMRLWGPRAELSLEIADGAERLELAARLVGELAWVAQRNGIRRFVAAGPTSNADIVELFGHAGGLGRGGWAVLAFPTAACLSLGGRRPALAPVL